MGQREVFLHHGCVALPLNATDALLQLDVDGERRTLRDHGDWYDSPFARLRDHLPRLLPAEAERHACQERRLS